MSKTESIGPSQHITDMIKRMPAPENITILAKSGTTYNFPVILFTIISETKVEIRGYDENHLYFTRLQTSDGSGTLEITPPPVFDK